MSDNTGVELVMLDPACTGRDARDLIEEAVDGGFSAVCLPPTPAGQSPAHPARGTASVAGYPSGKHHPLVKASEAHMAVVNGAQEVHAVLDASNVVAADGNAMISEIVTLREAVPYPAVLRVSPGEYGADVPDTASDTAPGTAAGDRVRAFCRAAVTAGADMVSAGSGHEASLMLEAVQGTNVTVTAPVRLPGVARVTVHR